MFINIRHTFIYSDTTIFLIFMSDFFVTTNKALDKMSDSSLFSFVRCFTFCRRRETNSTTKRKTIYVFYLDLIWFHSILSGSDKGGFLSTSKGMTKRLNKENDKSIVTPFVRIFNCELLDKHKLYY